MEIEKALHKVKNNMSSAICIIAELLKEDGDYINDWFLVIIDQVWLMEELSNHWRRNVIFPLWKRKSHCLLCDNH